MAPRIVRSSTLPTGFPKCGRGTAGMTLAAGKSGQCRYDQRNARIGKGRTP
jgi:hypothetical protein